MPDQNGGKNQGNGQPLHENKEGGDVKNVHSKKVSGEHKNYANKIKRHINNKTAEKKRDILKDQVKSVDQKQHGVVVENGNGNLSKNAGVENGAVKQSEPESVGSGVVKPDAIKAEVVKSEVAKPEAVKPDAIKPETVKPDVPRPSYENAKPINPFAPAQSQSGPVQNMFSQKSAVDGDVRVSVPAQQAQAQPSAPVQTQHDQALTPTTTQTPASTQSQPQAQHAQTQTPTQAPAQTPTPPVIPYNPFMQTKPLVSDAKKETKPMANSTNSSATSVTSKAPVNPFAAFSPKKEEPKVIDAEVIQQRANDDNVSKKILEKKDETREEPTKAKPTLASPFAPPKPSSDKIAEVHVVESGDKSERAEDGVRGHVEAPVSTMEKPQNVQEIQRFSSEVWDILGQAGITKDSIVKLLIVLIVIALGVAVYLFGWYKPVLEYFGIGDLNVSVEDDTEDDAEPDEEVPVLVPGFSGINGIVSGYIFGLEFDGPNFPPDAKPVGVWGSDAGIVSGVFFGKIADERKEKFVEYVSFLRDLDNIYNTDIYALLNMSTDRRATIEKHLTDMKTLIDKAVVIYTDIELQLQKYEAEYTPLLDQKVGYEQTFFDSIYSYQGERSYVALEYFTKNHQNAVALKSYFNAYKALRELYVSYVNVLSPRYQDISVNKEALIKGIQIFYVPQSDIRTIIKLDQ